MSVITDSKIIQGYKIRLPAAVQKILKVGKSDVVEFVLENDRVYLRKKNAIFVRRLETDKSARGSS